jgi:hypothetical protein
VDNYGQEDKIWSSSDFKEEDTGTQDKARECYISRFRESFTFNLLGAFLVLIL